MHVRNVANALRPAARRSSTSLVTPMPSAWVGLLLLTATASALGPAVTISAAQAALIEYDYTGNYFNRLYSRNPNNGPSPYEGQRIVGNIVIDTGDAPVDTRTSYFVQSLSLTDGYTSYSGRAIYVSQPYTYLTIAGGTVHLDADYNIVSWSLGVNGGSYPAPPFTVLNTTSSGDDSGITNAGGVTDFAAWADEIGTWSGPQVVGTGGSGDTGGTGDTGGGTGGSGGSGGTGGGGGSNGGSGGAPNTAACLQDLTGDGVLKANVTTNGPEIKAAFIPNGGIKKAQTDCGVQYFNWAQKLTYLPPYPSVYTSNGIIPPSGTPDPPPGGWDYQAKTGCPSTYPYYYSLTSPSGCLSLFEHLTDQALTFEDSPGDPCLPLAPNATPDQVATHKSHLDQYCGGKDSAANTELFTTTLVGVGGSLPINLYFSWGTTWNGTTGGTFRQNTDDAPDLDSGTGEAFIININGVPVAEPSSLSILLCSLILYTIVSVRMRGGDRV